jgi:hypothetical protein
MVIGPVTSPVSDCAVSYRPVLSSERVPYRNNKKELLIRIKSGYGPHRGARYQDELVGRKINSTILSSGAQYSLKTYTVPVTSDE